MCGLAGEVRVGELAYVESVARMGAAMTNRGPDGNGVWASGPLALSFRRLKIIDLSEQGSQPMVDSELGLTITFNGCIYNYPEFREMLEKKGYRFFSTSDTEVLLKAYHHWGENFVDCLKGMFAFCIAEHATKRVILGRDRLGIKPLYISESEGVLRFASALPALLAGGGVDTSIDTVALHRYLTRHSVVPTPCPILKGVRKLAPGTLPAPNQSSGTRHGIAEKS
jgi:asparagine synthase (glutamine-hydrolysing)